MSSDTIGMIVVGLVLFGIACVLLRAAWHFFAGVRDGLKKPGPTQRPLSQAASRQSIEPQTPPLERPSSVPVPARAKDQPPPTLPNAIFISYRREDSSDVAGRIYDRLVAAFGKAAVFKDVDTLPLGDDFRVHLEEAVARATVVLAIIGPRWYGTQEQSSGAKRLDSARDFVRIELSAALERRIPVVPVLVSGASMPDESELPDKLANLAYRNAIQVRPDPDFHSDVDRLVRGVQRLFERAGS
jgi:hypothetical protein